VQACIRGHERCLDEPHASQESCRIACGADKKAALQRCKQQADALQCEEAARLAATECKQRCTAAAAPRKQRCNQGFNDCLNACAR
jgi:hypothetical protein